ncbi:MAG: hypothetical protein ABR973_08555 [Candidatus Acidiferrales bacterium]|jgi:hypothetical protein
MTSVTPVIHAASDEATKTAAGATFPHGSFVANTTDVTSGEED